MLVRLCYNDRVWWPSFDVYHDRDTTRSTAVTRMYDGRRTTSRQAFTNK